MIFDFVAVSGLCLILTTLLNSNKFIRFNSSSNPCPSVDPVLSKALGVSAFTTYRPISAEFAFSPCYLIVPSFSFTAKEQLYSDDQIRAAIDLA